MENYMEENLYAGFWKRVGAYFIDAVILFIILAVFFFFWGFFGFPTGPKENFESLVLLISLILFWAYFAKMESSHLQASLGKMALGIVVTDMSGKQISFGRASCRYLAKAIPFFIFTILFPSSYFALYNKKKDPNYLIFSVIISFMVLIIINLMPAFTRKKQGLHDIIAGSLVLNKISSVAKNELIYEIHNSLNNSKEKSYSFNEEKGEGLKITDHNRLIVAGVVFIVTLIIGIGLLTLYDTKEENSTKITSKDSVGVNPVS